MNNNKSNRRYRLMKDMAYVKAGAIYQQSEISGEYDLITQEYLVEGVRWDGLGKEAVENALPGWFEEIVEPERIEVYRIQRCVTHKDATLFFTTQPIPEDKFPAIKSAIEEVLKEPEFPLEQIKKLTKHYQEMTDALGMKKYTASQLEEAEAKAEDKGFAAGRLFEQKRQQSINKDTK